LRGKHGAQQVGAIVEELQAARFRAFHDDADIGRAGLERFDDRAAALLAERELDGRMRRRERREVGGQVLGQCRRVRLDAHHALETMRVIGDLGAHLVDLGEHLARVEEEGLARGG
jgi:hypothetical protein